MKTGSAEENLRLIYRSIVIIYMIYRSIIIIVSYIINHHTAVMIIIMILGYLTWTAMGALRKRNWKGWQKNFQSWERSTMMMIPMMTIMMRMTMIDTMIQVTEGTTQRAFIEIDTDMDGCLSLQVIELLSFCLFVFLSFCLLNWFVLKEFVEAGLQQKVAATSLIVKVIDIFVSEWNKSYSNACKCSSIISTAEKRCL